MLFVQLTENTWVNSDTIEGFDVRAGCVRVWLSSGGEVATNYSEAEWLRFLAGKHELAPTEKVVAIQKPAFKQGGKI